MPNAHSDTPRRSIGRSTAVSLVVGFVILMVVPAIYEVLAHSSPSLAARFRDDVTKYGVQLALQEVEKHLVYDSQFASAVRQPYQRWLVARFRQGSRTVVIGADDMFFHRDDIANTTGRGVLGVNQRQEGTDVVEALFNWIRKSRKASTLEQAPPVIPPVRSDAIAVLSDLHRQLDARGVHLTILIVPAKSTVYPEKLWSAYPESAGPALNVDYPEWKARLATTGADLIDLSEFFWRAKNDREPMLFLERDSHWSPRGVAVAAEIVSAHVRPLLGQYAPLQMTVAKQTVPQPSDLVTLLGLRRDVKTSHQESIELTEVVPIGGDAATAGEAAPILLFGDSMTGYYQGNNTGHNAGFARQLMLRLNVGVQQVFGYGDEQIGAIQGALARTPSILAGKRVVVLEFASSALYSHRFSTMFRVR